LLKRCGHSGCSTSMKHETGGFVAVCLLLMSKKHRPHLKGRRHTDAGQSCGYLCPRSEEIKAQLQVGHATLRLRYSCRVGIWPRYGWEGPLPTSTLFHQAQWARLEVLNAYLFQTRWPLAQIGCSCRPVNDFNAGPSKGLRSQSACFKARDGV
jgi:hypothetical protein